MTVTFEQSVLTCVSLAAVAVLATMGVVVCVKELQLPAIRQSLRDLRRLPWYAQLFLVAFVSHLVVYGSVKTNQTNSAGGDATNSPPAMLMAPRPAVASAGGCGSQDLQPYTFPHWRHGVYEDGQRVGFADDWVFPFGTNHLSSVEVMSWGEILPNGFATTPIAAFGCHVSLVPEVSEFHYCRTPSNSYQFVWNNARDQRINGSPISGCIELFRNGDVVVGTNGVGTVTPYVIPFHHDGFGQDEVWVRANFTNAEEILSAGYANWVDDQIGVGLTNGLFKFTAYFPEVPPEATELVVGDYSVCVTNSGEYVFVFEKGKEYSFHTEPYDETVEYSMQDDFAPLAPVFMSMWGGEPPYEWSIDGGGYWLDYPGYGYFGHFGWLPTLQGSPTVMHLGPDDFPITFEAILSDYCGSETPTFRWGASDENIQFATPDAQQTEVECSSLPSWGTFSASVEADFGWYSLYSYLSPTYGTNDSPTVLFSSSAPELVFLNDDDRTSRWYRVWLDFGCEIGTNATVTLSHTGSTGIRFAADPDGGHSLTWSEVLSRVAAMPSVSHVEFYIACASIGRGEFVAECAIAGGDVRTKSMPYRVIEPLCRLVTSEMNSSYSRYVNPSKLVRGEPATLQIGVNGEFQPSEVEWEVFGAAITNADGFALTVTPTEGNDALVVSAVFNDDVDQPVFALPVVEKRRIPIRGFFVSSPESVFVDKEALKYMIDWANIVFCQVGIEFYLTNSTTEVSMPGCWDLVYDKWINDGVGRRKVLSDSAIELLDTYTGGDCVEVYIVGSIADVDSPSAKNVLSGLWTPRGIFIQYGKWTALAHELGHALGLSDCYSSCENATLSGLDKPITSSVFVDGDHDYFGNVEGRGFYSKNDTKASVLKRLLMYGIDDGGSDIPYGEVIALPECDGANVIAKPIAVGGSDIVGSDQEVFSR